MPNNADLALKVREHKLLSIERSNVGNGENRLCVVDTSHSGLFNAMELNTIMRKCRGRYITCNDGCPDFHMIGIATRTLFWDKFEVLEATTR
jgi:hypothetical protein